MPDSLLLPPLPSQGLLDAGMPDNILTHIGAGLGAGFIAVCVGSPVDVVKSRIMGDTTGACFTCCLLYYTMIQVVDAV